MQYPRFLTSIHALGDRKAKRNGERARVIEYQIDLLRVGLRWRPSHRVRHSARLDVVRGSDFPLEVCAASSAGRVGAHRARARAVRRRTAMRVHPALRVALAMRVLGRGRRVVRAGGCTAGIDRGEDDGEGAAH
jgi:hypothetical protein